MERFLTGIQQPVGQLAAYISDVFPTIKRRMDAFVFSKGNSIEVIGRRRG